MAAPKTKLSFSDKIWLISKAGEPSFDVERVFGKIWIESIKEYSISDLARYMISPTPVKIENRLVGCEIVHSISQWEKFKLKVKTLLSKEKKKARLKEVLMPTLMPASFNMAQGNSTATWKRYTLFWVPLTPWSSDCCPCLKRG